MLPEVVDLRSSYENIEALCPHCQGWATYNRATDLGTVTPVSGMEVTCLLPQCRQTFWLLGDSANHPFEMLLRDAEEHLPKKRFTVAILLAAQAVEVFAAFYVRQVLLYSPQPSGPDLTRHDELEGTTPLLFAAITPLPYQKMVCLLLNLCLLP